MTDQMAERMQAIAVSYSVELPKRSSGLLPAASLSLFCLSQEAVAAGGGGGPYATWRRSASSMPASIASAALGGRGTQRQILSMFAQPSAVRTSSMDHCPSGPCCLPAHQPVVYATYSMYFSRITGRASACACTNIEQQSRMFSVEACGDARTCQCRRSEEKQDNKSCWNRRMTVTIAGIGVGRTYNTAPSVVLHDCRHAGVASLAVTLGTVLCFARRVLGILHG